MLVRVITERERRSRAAPMAPEDRRAAIIVATVPLVRARGFDVSTRQIAEAAGVAEGTIFRVFDTKEELLQEAVRAALDPTEAEQQLRLIDRTAPLGDRVRAAALVLQQRMTDLLELAMAIGPAHLPAHDEVHRSHYSRLDTILADLFEPDREQLRCEPAEAVRLFQLLAFGGSHPRLTQGRPLTASEIADLLLDGIRRHVRNQPQATTNTTTEARSC